MSNSPYTPGSSVTIIAPPVVIAGVNASQAGLVGTATRGLVNVPTNITGNSFETVFGVPQARKYDGGTIVAEAALNGLSTVVFTRVTDGTDTTAVALIGNAAIGNTVLTALSTGSGYNGATVAYGAGGRANSINVTVTLPGSPTEVYQNLPASNATVFWAAHDAAINAGAGVLRGPSTTITANSALATHLPTLPSSVSLTGGTDGANLANSAPLIGDPDLKTGMYSLLGQGVLLAVLADCDDANTFTTQAAFGEQNFILMGSVLPAGSTPAGAVSTKHAMGLDSNEVVLLHGDWLTYNDPNAGLRKVSPQGYWLGNRSSLQPNQSSLNKVLNGIVGSETSAAGAPYTVAETDTLFSAGIDLICNPIPRGFAWGVAGGYNTSSNVAENSDAWSTMTNFLAQTFRQAGGPWVGEPNSVTTRAAVKAAFDHFLQGLVVQGLIDPGSYKTTCDLTNNTQDDITEGCLNVLVQVQYQGIIRFFRVGLQGGASVVITSSSS